MLSNAIDRDCKELVHACLLLLCSKGGECLPNKATHVVNIFSLFSCSGNCCLLRVARKGGYKGRV